MEVHIGKYGFETIYQYRQWFKAILEGQEHVPLDIAPDIRASLVHHRDVRERTLIFDISGALGTSREVIMTKKGKEEEKDGLGEGLQDMLQGLFGDILPSKEQMQAGDEEDA